MLARQIIRLKKCVYHLNNAIKLGQYNLTWVRRIQNRVSCVSNVLCTLIHGFFGNIQYAAIAPSMFTIKLSKHLCQECSIWAIFFNSSLTVSIMALFLKRSLSETLIKAPFILLLSFVISCIPFTNNLWKSSWPIYHLSPTNFPMQSFF